MENQPAFRPSFLIDSNMIPLNADVTKVAHRLFVTNFRSLPLLMVEVFNKFQCLDSVGNLFSGNVTILSKFSVMSL